MPRVGRRQSETEASNQRKARFKSNSTVHGMKDEMDFFCPLELFNFLSDLVYKKSRDKPKRCYLFTRTLRYRGNSLSDLYKVHAYLPS